MSLQTCDVYHDFILVLTHCHVSMNVVNTVVIYLIFNMANAPPPSLVLPSPLHSSSLPSSLSSSLLSHTLPSLLLPSSSPCFSLRKHLYHMILNWFHTDFSFRCYSLDCYREYGKLASCFTEWSMCTTCVSYKLSFIAILPSFSCKQHHGLYP